MLEVVCACLVGSSLLDSVALYCDAGSCVCMSSGKLPIGQHCFILRVLEIVCACLVGGSLLDIIALYCECNRLSVHV